MNLQLERKSVRKRKDKKLFKNLNLSNTGTRSPNCADADTECGIAVYEGCPLVKIYNCYCNNCSVEVTLSEVDETIRSF